MPDNTEEQLNILLQSLTDSTNDHSMMDLLESAHKGFTLGANDFADHASENLSPAEIKSNLRAYPLAQILISIVKYHELNKNTDIVRDTVLALLESLEESVLSESYELQTLETTLH